MRLSGQLGRASYMLWIGWQGKQAEGAAPLETPPAYSYIEPSVFVMDDERAYEIEKEKKLQEELAESAAS